MENSEELVANVLAQAFYSDPAAQDWVAFSPGYTQLTVYFDSQNVKDRIIARNVDDEAIILHSFVAAETDYQRSSETFHSLIHESVVYGFNFYAVEDANAFGNACEAAIKRQKELASNPVPAQADKGSKSNLAKQESVSNSNLSNQPKTDSKSNLSKSNVAPTDKGSKSNLSQKVEVTEQPLTANIQQKQVTETQKDTNTVKKSLDKINATAEPAKVEEVKPAETQIQSEPSKKSATHSSDTLKKSSSKIIAVVSHNEEQKNTSSRDPIVQQPPVLKAVEAKIEPSKTESVTAVPDSVKQEVSKAPEVNASVKVVEAPATAVPVTVAKKEEPLNPVDISKQNTSPKPTKESANITVTDVSSPKPQDKVTAANVAVGSPKPSDGDLKPKPSLATKPRGLSVSKPTPRKPSNESRQQPPDVSPAVTAQTTPAPSAHVPAVAVVAAPAPVTVVAPETVPIAVPVSVAAQETAPTPALVTVAAPEPAPTPAPVNVAEPSTVADHAPVSAPVQAAVASPAVNEAPSTFLKTEPVTTASSGSKQTLAKEDSGILDNLPTPDTPSNPIPPPTHVTPAFNTATDPLPIASTSDKYLTLKKKTMTLRKTGTEMMESPISGSFTFDFAQKPDDPKANNEAIQSAEVLNMKKMATSQPSPLELLKQQENSLTFATQLSSRKFSELSISDNQYSQLKKEIMEGIKHEFAVAKTEIIQALRVDLMKLIDAITMDS